MTTIYIKMTKQTVTVVFWLQSPKCYITSFKLPSFTTNCKILWVYPIILNTLLVPFYRPHVYNSISLDKLNFLLIKLHEIFNNSVIWFVGDFNTPGINWQDVSKDQYSHLLLNIIQDYNLTQFVTRLTHINDMLDLFLTNTSAEVSHLNTLPGISTMKLSQLFLTLNLKFLNNTPRKYCYITDINGTTEWRMCSNFDQYQYQYQSCWCCYTLV